MFESVRAKTLHTFGVPPYLSGFVCAFHSAAPGSNPKHTIYDFLKNIMHTFGKLKRSAFQTVHSLSVALTIWKFYPCYVANSFESNQR